MNWQEWIGLALGFLCGWALLVVALYLRPRKSRVITPEQTDREVDELIAEFDRVQRLRTRQPNPPYLSPADPTLRINRHDTEVRTFLRFQQPGGYE